MTNWVNAKTPPHLVPKFSAPSFLLAENTKFLTTHLSRRGYQAGLVKNATFGNCLGERTIRATLSHVIVYIEVS